jgi:hypothetical protein
MKSILLCLCCTFLCQNITYTQSTFSERYHLNLNSVVFTGIEQVSDSTYLVTGVVTDTIAPYLGATLSVLINEQGDELASYIVRDSVLNVEGWAQDEKIGNQIYKLGYHVELGVALRGLLIGYSLEGESLFIIDQLDARDTATFFRFNDMIGYNNKIYATGNSAYIGEGDNWWGATLTTYDQEGTELSNFTYETPNWRTWSRAIKQIDENILLIGGVMDDRNRKNNDFSSLCKLWAVDTLGNLLWTWQSPPDELQQGIQDMALAPDGGIVIATAIGEEVAANPDYGVLYWDHCIYKLNTDLEEEWRTMMRTSIALSTIQFDRIIKLSDESGYVAVGHGFKIYPDAEPWVENTADWGGIVAKVAPNGDSLWARVFVDPTVDTLTEYHALYDIIETPDGGLLMVGESNEPNPDVASQQGWLLKLDAYGCLVPGCQLVSAVSEAAGPEFQLLLYPNPVRDQLSVYLGPGELPTGSSWVIHDASGRVVDRQRARLAEATYLLSVGQLAAGTYSLQLRSGVGELLGVEQFVVAK